MPEVLGAKPSVDSLLLYQRCIQMWFRKYAEIINFSGNYLLDALIWFNALMYLYTDILFIF